MEHQQWAACMDCKWQAPLKEFMMSKAIGFGELPANPEDRPNMNDISKSSFAPPPGYPVPTMQEVDEIIKRHTKDKEVVEQGGTQFSTGAVRSSDKAGVMYHLITPIGMRRIAETYKEGFDKYGAFNWERGMPIGDILNHAIAHIYQFLSGVESGEDDLAHAAWNLMAAMHIQETHPELDHQLRFKLNEKKQSMLGVAVIGGKEIILELDPSTLKWKPSNEKQPINTPNDQATT